MPYKMPNAEYFLKKKKIFDKTEPVWEYLEREMREMDEKGIKPYNKVVGEWLIFLKDLKEHYRREAMRKERQLVNTIGPRWYFEFSTKQREVLSGLKQNIHQDIIEDLPKRVRRSLSDLGVTVRIPRSILMKAMKESEEDPGVFMWNLYSAVYKTSPSILRPKYDINAMILMSSLVFIDLDECIQSLEKLTKWEELPVPKRERSESIPTHPTELRNIVIEPKKYYEPKCRYGMYLQRMYVPCQNNEPKQKDSKPRPLGHKLKLRSDTSYEKLRQDSSFLAKRIERNRKAIQAERICEYPFWEPPAGLRNTNPKEAALASKMKMIKLKAKPKFKAPYPNVQFLVTGVVFCNEKPHYCLGSVAILPTGYIPIHGGFAPVLDGYMPKVDGQWRFPKAVKKGCERHCTCMEKWPANSAQRDSTQGEHIDLKHDVEKGMVTKFFHPPTRHGPYFLDKAKVYQFDPMEDFIKDCVREALMSKDPSAAPSETIQASALKEKDLLSSFLADLSDSPLIIPHLPQASSLNSLLEWTRRRVKGDISPQDHKKMFLTTGRQWQYLKHRDFRARAYRIPFTLKQLLNMNWSHRKLIMTLFHVLLDDFVSRNQIHQVEQTRYWWATTKYDPYPSKAFLDIFFTYMPARPKDTFLINPYSSELTPKHGGKTCPL